MWIVEPGSARHMNDSPDDEEQGGSAASDVHIKHVQDEGSTSPDQGASAEEPEGDDQAEQVPHLSRARRQPRYFDNNDGGAEFVPPRKIHDVCILCSQRNHFSNQCPAEMCLVCLQRGHRSRECPTNGRVCVCSRCGRIGHQRAHCPEQSRSLPNISNCRCLTCGSLGHLDCSEYEPRPRHISCSNCGARGHSAHECQQEGFDRWHRLFSVAISSSHAASSGSGKGAKRWDHPRANGSILSDRRGRAPARAGHGSSPGLANHMQSGFAMRAAVTSNLARGQHDAQEIDDPSFHRRRRKGKGNQGTAVASSYPLQQARHVSMCKRRRA